MHPHEEIEVVSERDESSSAGSSAQFASAAYVPNGGIVDGHIGSYSGSAASGDDDERSKNVVTFSSGSSSPTAASVESVAVALNLTKWVEQRIDAHLNRSSERFIDKATAMLEENVTLTWLEREGGLVYAASLLVIVAVVSFALWAVEKLLHVS